MDKAAIILSGGMDSTTLLYDIKRHNEPIALIFDYNQRHKKEIDCAHKTCIKLNVPYKIINLNVLNDIAPSVLTRNTLEVPEGNYNDENMKQTVVPNRNMVMLSLAASYCMSDGIKDLFYGAHAGDHDIYPDCRESFINSMRETLHLSDWNLCQLWAPYMNMNKGDIAKRGKELGVDYSLTWTCYKGKEKACGKCGSCTERLEAFEKAKMIDPIEYEGT